MYTLISHGSRIQVAQFHLFNAFGGETPDIADSKKVIDSNTAQEQLRIAENNKRNQEEVKNRIATAKSQEAISNIGMNPDSLKFELFSKLGNVFGTSVPKIDLAQSTENINGLTDKLPPIVSTSLPLMGASTDTNAPNTPEALPEKTHKIQAGDTLSQIAKANNTTVAELQRINSLTDSNKIRVGETLHIPSSTVTATAVSSAQANMAPAMPKPRINTAPNTPKITVASKPAEAPKVAVKTLQQQLEDANKELGSAVYGKTLPDANKDYYTNLENTARANIATLEQKIKTQEKATQYAGFSENKKIWADFSEKYNKLQKESVTAGSVFTKSTEFKQAEKDVIMSNTIVKTDEKIAEWNTKYNILKGINTNPVALERNNINKEIARLTELNKTQIANLERSPNYASVQATRKLA